MAYLEADAEKIPLDALGTTANAVNWTIEAIAEDLEHESGDSGADRSSNGDKRADNLLPACGGNAPLIEGRGYTGGSF
jgi:hypothetical protein